MRKTRTLQAIASEISSDWDDPYFGARPYINAMSYLASVTDFYGADSGRSIVAYFLANAGTWRGETARRVKAELKAMVR
jgi:hypothetical protein